MSLNTDRSSINKPSIVAVHGSWLSPAVYEGLCERLRSLGYETVSPTLPSTGKWGSDDHVRTNLHDDSASIRQVVTKLVEERGKEVVVMMHSYGGMVGSEAVTYQLTARSRAASGLPGGVVYLIYRAAFVIPAGQSFETYFGPVGYQNIENDVFTHADARGAVFSDVPEEEVDRWIPTLVPHPMAIQRTTVERTACDYVPSTYVVLTEDKAAPPEFQESVASFTKSKRRYLQSGHMDVLTKPDELAALIDDIVQKDIAAVESNATLGGD